MTAALAIVPSTVRGRLIAGAAVALVVVGAVVASRLLGASEPASFETRPVARATVQETVTVVGSIRPAAEVHLTFRPGGTLAEVLVKVGQPVAAGQPLARLDTRDLEAAVRQAQASLRLAQARYDEVAAGATAQDIALARQAVEAAQVSYDQAKRGSASDLTAAQRALETSTADLDQARRDRASAIDSALQALERTKTSFASARANLASQVAAVRSAVAAYGAAIAPARATLEGVIDRTEDLLPSADLDAARASLNDADVKLAVAQGYVSDVLVPALDAYVAAVDGVVVAVAAFDAAVSSGADPTGTVATYQRAEYAYQLAAGRLASAIGVPNGEVAKALTSVSAAKTSLDTLDEQDRYVLDDERADVVAVATALADLGQQATRIAAAASQATTSLATVTATVNGGYVAAQDAYDAAVSGGDAAVRAAQDRVDAAGDALSAVRDRGASTVSSLEIALRNAQTGLDRTVAGAKATELTQALASVQLAQVGLDEAKLALERATLVAPAAGTVAAIPAHVGETVAAPADVVVLALTADLSLHGTAGEADVGKLALGQAADVIVNTAGTEARRAGTVTAVDPVATIVDGAPGYGVDVSLQGPAAGIRPGMTGTARIVVASKQNVLTVPSAAVHADGSRRYVLVLRSATPVEADVAVGLAGGGVTEITAGLEEGQPVVLPRPRETSSNGITIGASEPFAYAAAVEPTLQRVAVLVTVRNSSDDDLQVDPADFVARDASRRVYRADPKAAVADARAVRAEASLRGMVGIQPLAAMTLRKGDAVEGFVVFDLPVDARPAQVIFRQTDEDHVVDLAGR